MHNSNIDEVLFVQKFLDGLKYSISNAITLHRPRTVDVALSMALMREEMMENSVRRFQTRVLREFSKSTTRPQQQQHTASILGTPATEATKPPTANAAPVLMRTDSKPQALHAQRRKLGLCMKCGEKWSKTHK